MADLHDSPASSRLWSQLTEPTASIQDPEQRRQAQFLATLFVILGPIGIIGVVLPGISNQEPLLNPETLPIYVSAVLIAAMTYVLSRTIWYKAAAWVAVLASSLVIFLSNFIDPTPEGLFYLIIPVLIGGILLSIRATAIVAAVQVVGMSLLPLAIPAADWARTLPYPLAFNIIASVLVLLVARHRNRIERERQAGLVQQIAERRQIEQQLRYQANLLENVTDAIISTDLQFKIQSWNQAAEAIYGWSAQEALGRNIDELLHATFPNDTPQEVLQRFQANGFWRGEVSHQRKDGSRVYILSSVSLVRDSAGMPGCR